MITVLLAVDETAESTDAVRQARHLFGPEATYLAVNVAEAAAHWTPVPMAWGAVYPYPFGADVPDVVPRDDLADGNAPITGARATAREVADAAGVDAAPVGEVGDPATAILDAAESHAADVIVVGSTQKGWWRRLFEGSVSRDITARSPVPVLVAGQGDDGEDGARS